MWIAISEREMAMTLIRTNIFGGVLEGKTITSTTQDSNCIFWLNLAGAHYSNIAIQSMTENINFVDIKAYSKLLWGGGGWGQKFNDNYLEARTYMNN